MANNRLQIYCEQCREMKGLAKYYPVDWTVPEDIGRGINIFLEEHKECFEKSTDTSFGTGMFKFRTEMDEDGLISNYSQRPFRVEYEKVFPPSVT